MPCNLHHYDQTVKFTLSRFKNKFEPMRTATLMMKAFKYFNMYIKRNDSPHYVCLSNLYPFLPLSNSDPQISEHPIYRVCIRTYIYRDVVLWPPYKPHRTKSIHTNSMAHGARGQRCNCITSVYTQIHICGERDARAIHPRRLLEHKRIDGA